MDIDDPAELLMIGKYGFHAANSIAEGDTLMNFPLLKVPYAALAKMGRAQENYNFHKVSSVLAEYGFTTMRLSNDWKGADFIACHLNGDVIKVQLKGRLHFDKSYVGKDIFMCFRHANSIYLFPHDLILEQAGKEAAFQLTKSWCESGSFH